MEFSRLMYPGDHAELTPKRGVTVRITLASLLIASALLLGGIVTWGKLEPSYGLSEAELRAFARNEEAKLSFLVETLRASTTEKGLGLMGSELILYPTNERVTLDPDTNNWRDTDGQRVSSEVIQDRTGVSSQLLSRAMKICRELGLPMVMGFRDQPDQELSVVVYTGGMLGWGRRGLLQMQRDAAEHNDRSYSYVKTDAEGWYTFESLD